MSITINGTDFVGTIQEAIDAATPGQTVVLSNAARSPFMTVPIWTARALPSST
jgi:hypothetical protein